KQLMEENKEYCTYIREEVLRIPKLRTLTLEEIGSVPRFSDEEPGELLLSSIREMLEKENVRGEDISLILDFSTCSRDRNGISLCYKVQHEI
ncbi:MAG: hypothetical protein GWN61_02500, partial [candidate division Zixibacteria bacterium]|nr:hypothetical protein [candidate division Zixibacteria bacterium]NIS44919.1 hypothetical protein [candidate division Zixibacteria bacterium]NIU14545.1 hypothetical protein [candidate division Zixibacteria bacterium]NIV05081.1 hypothetical protein [candidate division Zixibacteria bacterium]NIW39230.1 hypothetical protein [candidate division Zixibacteria bacterium]